MKEKSIEDRIAFIKHCAKRYESFGDSPLTDAEYDLELKNLKELRPEDSFFNSVGGDVKDCHGKSIKHNAVMGSLNKSESVDEFKTWIKSQYKNNSFLEFIFQPKVDGLSLSLKYDKSGKFIHAVTRGDGEVGIIAPNAIYVDGVLDKITLSPNETENITSEIIEIRGECYKEKKSFYEEWHTSVLGEKGFANPRNFTPGSLLTHDPSITNKRKLSFVAYEVIGILFKTEIEKNEFLNKSGFNTLLKFTSKTEKEMSFDQISLFAEKYMKEIGRDSLDYEIDGVVCKINDIAVKEELGYTNEGKRPRANRAIKYPPEEKQTKIKDITFNVNRTGIISPIAVLEPVELGGAIISKVSLYNFANVRDNPDIKIGSVVKIQKRGDIIPAIVGVISAGKENIKIPENCPCCSENLEWDNNKINLMCINPNCTAQLSSSIEHWLIKIGVKGIGPGILNKLTDKTEINISGQACVKTISDIYSLKEKKKELSCFFGEKAFQNILDSIDSVNEIPLEIFIEALGIGKIGTMAKDIVAIAPDVESIDNIKIEDIILLRGFAEIKAKNFINGWTKIRPEINKILEHIKIKRSVNIGDSLSGKKFCFTGSFKNPTRREMEKMVPEFGGKLTSVSKDLTALVWDGQTMRGKYEKAQKIGVEIISQKEFLKILNAKHCEQ